MNYFTRLTIDNFFIPPVPIADALHKLLNDGKPTGLTALRNHSN